MVHSIAKRDQVQFIRDMIYGQEGNCDDSIFDLGLSTKETLALAKKLLLSVTEGEVVSVLRYLGLSGRGLSTYGFETNILFSNILKNTNVGLRLTAHIFDDRISGTCDSILDFMARAVDTSTLSRYLELGHGSLSRSSTDIHWITQFTQYCRAKNQRRAWEILNTATKGKRFKSDDYLGGCRGEPATRGLASLESRLISPVSKQALIQMVTDLFALMEKKKLVPSQSFVANDPCPPEVLPYHYRFDSRNRKVCKVVRGPYNIGYIIAKDYHLLGSEDPDEQLSGKMIAQIGWVIANRDNERHRVNLQIKADALR